MDESRILGRRARGRAAKRFRAALAPCVAVLPLMLGCTIEEVTSVVDTVVDEDTPRLLVTETGGSTVVGEGGAFDALSVALEAEPTSVVVLRVTSGDPGEVRVSPSELAFTASNWSQPRTITVIGVDDQIVDGLQTTAVTVAVDSDDSDAAFASTPDVSVAVSTADDDVGGVRVTGLGGASVAETGTAGSFAAALTAGPMSNVVLTVTSGDAGEATVSPASLTFTPESWAVLQTVTVMGVDDDVVDGTQTTIVTVAVDALSSDDAFDGAAPVVVSVTTTDDDVPGVMLTESDGSTVLTVPGGTDSFTAVLTAQPESNVVLEVSAKGKGDVMMSPTSLTFTPANWNVAQTVTVMPAGPWRGDDDDDDDDDHRGRTETATITVSVRESVSDDRFESMPDQTITVRITTD